MDAVVTGVILSGIVASIYGVKKLREKDQENTTHVIEHNIEPIQRKKSFIQRLL